VDYLPVEGFFEYDVRIGTIVAAAPNEKARKPAYHLTIDFGPYGIKESSAQVTQHYQVQDLVGRQVVAVMNFPPRQIAGVRSDVLVLGGILDDNSVVLLKPDRSLPNGTPIA